MHSKNMANYLIDLNPFFSDPMRFLEDLRAVEFSPKGYDCSAQIAIRLMRWSQCIQWTPRQNHVANAIINEAIQRGAKIIRSKIRAADWSIPDHRGDHQDLAISAATKALQHLAEKHDLAQIPHPNIATYVDVHTRFVSREALEDFIYGKRLKAESGQVHEATFSKAALERVIRQRRSELKSLAGEKRLKKRQELERLEAILHGVRSEVRLEYALEERGDRETRSADNWLSPEDVEALATDPISTESDDDDYEMPFDQCEFLDLIVQVGKRQMPARQLIRYLVEARDYRAVMGLLRVMRQGGGLGVEAASLREFLGNQPLCDIRKQVLRSTRSDKEEVVSLLETCKAYLRGESDDQEVMAALQVASL